MLAPLLRRRRLVIGFFVALAAAAAPGLPRLEIDNSPEAFFVQDDDALERYHRFARTFSNFGSLRVALSGPGVWTAEGLAWLKRLEDRIQPLRGVIAAAGLPARHQASLGRWPPADPEAFRRAALADPLGRGAGLIGETGAVVSMMVAVGNLSVGERRRLLDDLEALLVSPPPGIDALVGGLPVVNRELDRAFARVALRFFPLLALVTIGLLALVLRSASDVARPLALVAFCEIGVFGAMGWAGARLDVVTMILAPLLLVLTLATAVHLLLRFRALAAAGMEIDEAVVETYRDKGRPVLWTGITTAVGFGSLAISRVPPVHSLGLWTAAGIGLMTLAAFTLYPALMASGPTPARRESGFETALRRFGRRAATAAVNRRGAVIALFALAAIPAAWGVSRLETETSVISYFRPDHPLRSDIERLESQGMAIAAAELIVERPEGSFADPGELARLRELAEALRREPLVFGVVSAADLQSPEAPPDDRFHRAMRGMLLEREGSAARINLLIPLLGFQELGPLFDRAVAAASESFPRGTAWITGRYPLVLDAQRTLLRTLIVSLSLTLLCVAVLFVAILRQPRLAALALIPNLWPVLFVLGAMGWAGVPIDSATVMIASVVLGLAVDDTLHYLARFRRLAPRRGEAAAAVETLEQTAGAHTLTSLILAAGFAVCGLSEFVPVARFGALCAAAILMALAADLFLVPALLGRRGDAGPVTQAAARRRDRK